MIQHVVLLKCKQGLAGELSKVLKGFCAKAPAEIGGVTVASFGSNFCEVTPDYSHGLVVTLRDKNALSNYVSHPEHLKVAAALKQLIESRVIVDYEF